MQGVLIGLVSQTFAQPASIDVDDRLAIHRFHGLKTALTCTCVDHVLDMAMEDGFGDYVAQALAATMAAKWHTSGTWQVCTSVARLRMPCGAQAMLPLLLSVQRCVRSCGASKHPKSCWHHQRQSCIVVPGTAAALCLVQLHT